jgi:hypothetical protein
MDEQRITQLQVERQKLWERMYEVRWDMMLSPDERKSRIHNLIEELSQLESRLRVAIDTANTDFLASLKLTALSPEFDSTYSQMLTRISHAKEALEKQEVEKIQTLRSSLPDASPAERWNKLYRMYNEQKNHAAAREDREKQILQIRGGSGACRSSETTECVAVLVATSTGGSDVLRFGNSGRNGGGKKRKKKNNARAPSA